MIALPLKGQAMTNEAPTTPRHLAAAADARDRVAKALDLKAPTPTKSRR